MDHLFVINSLNAEADAKYGKKTDIKAGKNLIEFPPRQPIRRIAA